MKLVELPDGCIRFSKRMATDAEERRWLAALLAQTNWRQERIRLFGRSYLTPRLTAWHGDQGARYRYSGLELRPEPWTDVLKAIKERAEAASGASFNSVLLNCYRDGRDGMGWHSDDEPELGAAPVIGSLSLGARRRFLLRHKSAPKRRLALHLHGGSYLEMSGPTQRHWRHSVPKAAAPTGLRINLTFRTVIKAETQPAP